ncbi:hypothetical protein [Acinetobacter pittii]|uniref:Uncharacterized protein n=1 Tax=Acinetobacter pittii TaxID=48296 RepID=A0A6H0G023_ACIPI|nr:hypothetical protein [Acinetobacter pittii]QIT19971.1 hypothetical protein G8E09_19350 [Acinetobacter pittii]
MSPLQVYGNICLGGSIGIAFNGIHNADVFNNYIANTGVGFLFNNMSGTINVKGNQYYQVNTANQITEDENFKPVESFENLSGSTGSEAKNEVSKVIIEKTNNDRFSFSVKLESLRKRLIKQLLNLEAQAYFCNDNKALNTIRFVKANLGSKKVGLDFRAETIDKLQMQDLLTISLLLNKS